MCECGLEDNYIFKFRYSYAKDGEVQLILATHVDDLFWECKPSAEHIITKIESLFILGTDDVHIFWYCGKEVTQGLGTFSIKVHAVRLPKSLQRLNYH